MIFKNQEFVGKVMAAAYPYNNDEWKVEPILGEIQYPLGWSVGNLKSTNRNKYFLLLKISLSNIQNLLLQKSVNDLWAFRES
ncbi:hypothetical protein LEP1GSC100_3267 [Leptospira interrogans serovar Bataviae str. UI 08561]|nr:hypothetical protein LEP1GSC100_3267 [Leptospira interrogans serovar Bataviae str. UI 08561]